MRVENTAAGWESFANQILTAKPNEIHSINAEIHIEGALDPTQLSALQYSLLEFDRIEGLCHRQIAKRLSIYANSINDAYRILHFFRIITRTRRGLTLSVYNGNIPIREAKDGGDWSVSLGRIFPLLCIGQSNENRSIAKYDLFSLPKDPKEVRWQLSHLFQNGTPPPVNDESVADIIEYYIMDRLQRVFEDLSGTVQANLYDDMKLKLQQELQGILLEQIPHLSLLSRMLWTISLWTMALSKDLLCLNESDSWVLDQETIHCSRLDAISYGEGLQQLIENACIHSHMRRAYLTIRIHQTDITGDGPVELSQAAQVRMGLQHRLHFLAGDPEEKRAEIYQLKPSVKYCFEFQVINDSVSYDEVSQDRPQYIGIAEKYCKNNHIPWPTDAEYTLQDIFEEKMLPPAVKNAPEHLVQHYGLQIFKKTVKLNDGYFHVSSPGLDRKGCLRLDSYPTLDLESEEDISAEKHPKQPVERYTAYFILLPIFPHWHSADGAEEKSSPEPQELFETAGLIRDYRQIILRFEPFSGTAAGKTPGIFQQMNYIQEPREEMSPSSYPISASPEEKMEMVHSLYAAMTEQLSDETEQTICLLDLMQVGNYGQIELLAKMLFLYIARLLEGQESRPRLFALLLPAKEYVWEFIRIFSIFYDKMGTRQVTAQVALCTYPKEPLNDSPIPEVAFLLTGGNSASARITARVFAYYNAGSSMETIPQLRYLTRGAGNQAISIPQFPFDLFLTAETKPLLPDSMGKPWFLRHMEQHLESDLWKQALGCRIHGIKLRLKSNILLTDFYEAELLFHNIGIVYRFAYLIARDILRQLNEKPQEKLVLVGYENYSSVLINHVTHLLRKEKQNCDIQYLIYSGNAETAQLLHLSPELQSMEKNACSAYLQQAACVIVVPIGTTLSTIYHIQTQMEADTGGEGRGAQFPFEHYALILVGCVETDAPPLSDQYWQPVASNFQMLGLVHLEPLKKDYPQAFVRFLLKPSTNWSQSYKVDLEHPLEEQVLVYVDQTSTIPRDIFVGERTRFFGISRLIGGTQAQEENERRARLLKSCIYYGHMATSNNHFQFYFDMDRYFAKANASTDTSSKNPRKKSVEQWLKDLRGTINPNAYNIIVSPLHQEDSPFAKAVADQVFEHSLRFLHIDFSDTFREDIRAKFSYVAEEYAKIKRFDQAKTVNVYFVNTAITSGATLRRARNLIMMLLEESGTVYDRGNVFKGCFVLVNRSGYDTLNSYIRQPQSNFHAYVHLAVPLLNLRRNRCPTCELVDQYRLIEQRCSSSQLRKEFRRLAEKHEKRDVSQYISWQEYIVITHSGYTSWLRQWLHSYVRERKPARTEKNATVGIFVVDREELLRLQGLSRLLAWGLEQYLSEKGLNKAPEPEQEEAFLERLSSFSLHHLSRLVEQDPDGARNIVGAEAEGCLSPDYWRHVVLDYVCGQKNYMRLMAIHRTFLETEELNGVSQEERTSITKEKLLDIISEALEETKSGTGKDALNVEWIISYLKVISRPHLAQYHHIRQAILTLLLQLADAAVQDGPLPEDMDHRLKGLCVYLRKEREEMLSPLLQYQLLKTVLKRLAGLQSSYFLQRKHQLQMFQRLYSLRQRYFDRPSKVSQQKRWMLDMEFHPFPPEEDLQLAMVKLVKWASSCGDDENGCYLIEEQFGEEVSANGAQG